MTDATARSPLNRWVLVALTAVLSLAALWLASRLVAACADATTSCGSAGRAAPAVIGAIVVVLVAVATLVATALAPEEVRGRLFGLLYACLVILALLAVVMTVVSGGFTLPPTFDL